MRASCLSSKHGLAQEGRPICNFDVQLGRLYRWADGENAGELAYFQLLITSETAGYQHLIPAAGASRLSFLRQHPDLWVSRKGRDVLHARIAGMITTRIRGPATGWAFCQSGLHRLEDRTVFVAGNRVIGGAGVDVVLPPGIAKLQLRQSNLSPRAITEELLTRLDNYGSAVAIPVFAFGVLTALQSLVLECGIPLTGVLYISGPSGFGKTETVKRFFALYDFAASGQPALITEAGSTMAGFRENLRLARDLHVVLDDLCLSSGRESQRKRLELGAQVIREASNKGAVRTRAGDHGAEPFTAAGVAITAEFKMHTISDVSRCIILPLEEPMQGGKAG